MRFEPRCTATRATTPPRPGPPTRRARPPAWPARWSRTSPEAPGRPQTPWPHGRPARRSGRPGRYPAPSRPRASARGAVAGEDDLPIASYDSLKAAEIVERLPRLSQVELGTVDAYERRHSARRTILAKIDLLRGDEPWTGYDEQGVGEVEARVREADEEEARRVRDYERRHKGRKGVLEAAQRSVAAR